MGKDKKEVAKSQQGEKANDGSQGNPATEGAAGFLLPDGESKDRAGNKGVQHKHRLPKNDFFGPNKP